MLRRLGRSLAAGIAARQLSTAPGCFAGIPGLQQASDWLKLAAAAHEKCQGLVDQVITSPPSSHTVQLLDDISDTLCQVLDAAEFCRNVHSLPEWRAAAERVCVELGAYTQTLNTHYALYTALAAALPPPDPAPSARGPPPPPPAGAPAAAGWDQETVLVGRLLLRDFERYGVHLSGPAQDRMGALMAESQVLGMRFTQNLADPAACGAAALPPAAVARLPHHLQRLFRRVPGSNGGGREGALSAAGTSRTLSALLAGAGDEAVRREAYRVYCAHPAANADVLEQLLAARREMAALMGYQSFAAYQLQGFSLAARPQAVAQFLAGLGAAVAPAAQAEAAQLRELKRRLGGRAAAAPPSSHSSSAFDGRGGAAPAALRPWDRDWLLGAAREGHPGDEAARALCAYLTVDGCIRGLSELLRRLMRVSLVEEAPAAGEAWAPGVRRLVARHEEEGPLGVVYLDLAPRPGKFPGAAHFTLRCGRAAAGGGYQTPVVALVGAMDPSGPLSPSQLETLLHEFGHALHSLLSRTRLQHASGTRGPPDLVELPSHVFEAFACAPQALPLFARHPATGEAPPPALLRDVAASRRQFQGLAVQAAVHTCQVDMLLHGAAPPGAAAAAVAELAASGSPFGAAPGARPHLRLNHLVGYGATYHSYLFAQCLSASLWERHLGADPCGRAAGDRLRAGLLAPGGAREAAALVGGLFDPGEGEGVLVAAEGGGHYPAAGAMLRQLGLG